MDGSVVNAGNEAFQWSARKHVIYKTLFAEQRQRFTWTINLPSTPFPHVARAATAAGNLCISCAQTPVVCYR